MDFKRMRWLIKEIPDAQYRVERAKSKAMKVTQVLSDMPHGTDVSSPVENGYNIIESAETYLNKLYAEMESMRNTVIPEIEALDDEQSRSAMQMRYVNGLPAQYIAEIMGYTDQRIFQILRKAEKDINRNEKLSTRL